MKHPRNHVLELGRSMMGPGQFSFPTPLFLMLDHATTQPLIHFVGIPEVSGEATAWRMVACTETSLIEVVGTVDGDNALGGDASVRVRPLSEIAEFSVENLEVVDDFSDYVTTAAWRVKFRSGESVEMSSIGLNSAATRGAVEALGAHLRDYLAN